MEINNYELNRVYLHEPSASHPFGIWVDALSGEHRICWRCGDRGTAWVVYLYMEGGTYLRLCHVDLYQYVEIGFLKPKKDGSIPAKGRDFVLTSYPTKFAKVDLEVFGV